MKSTQYSEKTLDHFRNPRNVGTLEGDDVAVGRVGNPVCGDLMEMYVRIKDDRIDDIKFQTFGCGSAVATSSMITELVMGKTLDEAIEVTGPTWPTRSTVCRRSRCTARTWRPTLCTTPSRTGARAHASSRCGRRDRRRGRGLRRARGHGHRGRREFAGKGVYTAVDDVSQLADKRVLVLDKGDRLGQAGPRADRGHAAGRSSSPSWTPWGCPTTSPPRSSAQTSRCSTSRACWPCAARARWRRSDPRPRRGRRVRVVRRRGGVTGSLIAVEAADHRDARRSEANSVAGRLQGGFTETSEAPYPSLSPGVLPGRPHSCRGRRAPSPAGPQGLS